MLLKELFADFEDFTWDKPKSITVFGFMSGQRLVWRVSFPKYRPSGYFTNNRGLISSLHNKHLHLLLTNLVRFTGYLMATRFSSHHNYASNANYILSLN